MTDAAIATTAGARDGAWPTLHAHDDFVPSAAARRLEARSYRRMLGVLRRPVAQPREGVAVPAVLIPGFVSGEVSMALLSRHLRRHGHRTFGSGVGANLGCTDAMVRRVVRRVEALVANEKEPVALVGHSRGGMIAKIVALRRPDLVAGVVVLSAPVTGTLTVASHVRRELEQLFALHRRGLRNVISQDCVTGRCAADISSELTQTLAAPMPYTSIFSRNDAIIDWRTCLDPGATLIEVDSAHTGMPTDPAVLTLVADRLTGLAS